MTNPPRPSRLGQYGRVTRDLCLMAVGILGFVEVPPSIQSLGFNAGNITLVWATVLLSGSVLSLIGVATSKPLVEINGCALVAAGFMIWFIAAVTQTDATLVSWQVGLVLLSGVAGQVYRIDKIVEETAKRKVLGDDV